MSTPHNIPPTALIPTYPILYKNKSKGKVSKWEIKIDPVYDQSMNPMKYNICVTFGEIDGKKQTHITVIEKGKSNRSIKQQAILEANSKWKEKTERDGYTPTAKTNTIITTDVGMGMDVGTDVGLVTRFSPMLANTFIEKNYTDASTARGYKIPFPAFVQRKYDGIRCIARTDHLKNVILESRKGVKFPHIAHIEFLLKLFFEQAGLLLQGRSGEMSPPTTLYFDGELYCDSLPFETINGCVRLTKVITEEERANINKLQYHIYDCYMQDKPNASFKQRTAFLKEVFDKVREEDALRTSANMICEVETEVVANLKEIKTKHAQYVESGFEGIMIRDPSGIYEPNKRSKYLQKYKEFMEEEFEIVGFHDGEGVDKEMVIWDCVTKEGRRFAVRPKTTFEERKRLFKEATSHIGKQLTVVFQEYSPDLVPRFPVGKAIRENV
jgi:ATP-dependent DNA ligase